MNSIVVDFYTSVQASVKTSNLWVIRRTALSWLFVPPLKKKEEIRGE